ncbi:MAG: AMP-binding protein, partial [Candidatus Aminicenantes bacterium]|nr:AMP-binding protein [Candidatus Aminicenantes bacterium]NIM79022.1 AMP-binding protein [Candidatus Aminicenantes bacterium]NIN19333.1 AMP-binding protein [Candidatus Aminicenantes bacterium]NIN85974.1 AMP-binding protein [Candidatus Aminicenantes bacterium]NIO82242.1 AMP-binding protein [Candidatus Aminicenantes bacterium]
GQLTYGELNKRSDQVARLLCEKGVGPDTIVGIMVERSIELIIGIMGILKAGGAYLPIDLNYPQERTNYMLKDSNVRVLLKKSEIRISKSETNPNDR